MRRLLVILSLALFVGAAWPDAAEARCRGGRCGIGARVRGHVHWPRLFRGGRHGCRHCR
jgi:hypothetical protein